VPTGLLGDLLDKEGVEEVDLLKMDIEGGEAMVLPTMNEDLSAHRYKRILLELHPLALNECGVSPLALITKLLNYGYRGWKVDHSYSSFWRAAYHLPGSANEFLSPVNGKTNLDAWPHILFLAPGIQAEW
jgi:hypothetical protein